MSGKQSSTPSGRVVFIGAGPGDVGSLTMRAIEVLGMAELVVADPAVPRTLVSRCCDASAEIVYVSDSDEPHTRAARVRMAAKAASLGQRVVRLFHGDGTMFAGLTDEMLACAHAGVDYDIVPGVSHVTAALFAGVPLTPPGNSSVHVIDASREDADGETIALQGTGEQILQVVDRLLAQGQPGGTDVVLVSAGGTTRQRSLVSTLAGLRKALRRVDLGPGPLLAVIGTGVAMRGDIEWFESKPLFGWQILVPSTCEDPGDICRRIVEYGAVPTVLPTIGIEQPRSGRPMERAVEGVVNGEFAWIGFTSVHAVRAVREKFVEYGLDARALAGIKVAVVHGAAATAVRAWGLEPDLVGTQAGVRALLDVWPAFDPSIDPLSRVFLPRADIATDTLIDGLTKLDWHVDDVTAFRTVRAAPPDVSIREGIKQGRYDAVVFASAAGVRNTVGIAGKPHHGSVIACIGPASAAAAGELGLRVDAVAEVPDGAAMIDALAAHAQARRASATEAGVAPRRPSEGRRNLARRKAMWA